MDHRATGICVFARRTGDGAPVLDSHIGNLRTLSDDRGAIPKRENLATYDPDTRGRVRAFANEIAIASPGAENQIGKGRAAVFQNACGFGFQGASGIDVTLADERVSVGGHAVFVHRCFRHVDPRVIFGHIERHGRASLRNPWQGQNESAGYHYRFQHFKVL